jgi:hypothetical protein
MERWQKESVAQADVFFGIKKWRGALLNKFPIGKKERFLIRLYKYRLQKWFRYVLPLPFKPKENQLFHIMLCSNYEAGVRAIRDFYCSKTGNPHYLPDNSQTLDKFRRLHPTLFVSMHGTRRPLEWKMLWKIIRDHEGGVCDPLCRDFREMERATWKAQNSLDWLEKQGYICRFIIENPWLHSYRRYTLNWRFAKES